MEHAGEDGGEVGEVGDASAVFGEEAVDGFLEHVFVRVTVRVRVSIHHFWEIWLGVKGKSEGEGNEGKLKGERNPRFYGRCRENGRERNIHFVNGQLF